MHLPFFYCQVDSLLPPATTCSVCTWLGRVSPCHRRPSSQCQIPPLPETSESVWLLPATSPSHTALILWLFSWHLGQKMSSYKQILFSFALISLLADTFPVSPMLGFLSLLGTSLFHLGKAPGLCGFASHLCKVAVGGGDSAAVSRSDTGGSTASSFIG